MVRWHPRCSLTSTVYDATGMCRVSCSMTEGDPHNWRARPVICNTHARITYVMCRSGKGLYVNSPTAGTSEVMPSYYTQVGQSSQVSSLCFHCRAS